MQTFQKATKKQSRARIGLVGVAGSGKTFSALRIAKGLGARVAVIDSERGSASKYADEFEFDVLDLDEHSPDTYVRSIKAAEAAGYDVLVIDSLSHAWMGKGGALEQVDAASKRSKGNSYVAWRDVTPQHNALVDAMLTSRCHVIATLRAKAEYAQERDEKTGKTTIKKVGMAPIQRDGLDYEFDIVGDLDLDHNLMIGKTRCRALDGKVFHKPGDDLASAIRAWLTDGAAAPPPVDDPAAARIAYYTRMLPMAETAQHYEALRSEREAEQPEIRDAVTAKTSALWKQHAKRVGWKPATDGKAP